MPRSLCQVVLAPSLLLALGASGCFLSHGDDDPAVGRTDAGSPLPGYDASTPTPVRDAATPSPRPDAGPPPDGCSVAPIAARVDRACVPGTDGAAPPGESFALPVFLDGCFCDARVYCHVGFAGGRVLDLVTTMCPDEADCFACVPTLEAACEIPPLEEGDWLVRVNGEPAFDLRVREGEPGLLPQRTCYDVAPAPDGSLICDWPGDFTPSSMEACGPLEAPPGVPVPITVSDLCATCFDLEGSCEVSVMGDRIHVMPATRRCDCPVCGACADICERRDVECHTPPLAVGTYTVVTPAGELELRVDETAPLTPPGVCLGAGSAGTP